MNLKKQKQYLTKQILQEKTRHSPNQNNIGIWQEKLQDFENYRAQGNVIRSKEKQKQKQTKKQIKKLQKGDKTTSDFEILKQCQDYYQKLYTKSDTCNITQQQLLQKLPKKSNSTTK